jgi:hypothetical protein
LLTNLLHSEGLFSHVNGILFNFVLFQSQLFVIITPYLPFIFILAFQISRKYYFYSTPMNVEKVNPRLASLATPKGGLIRFHRIRKREFKLDPAPGK